MKTVHQYQIAYDNQDSVLKLKQGFRVVHSEFSVLDKAVNLWVEEPLSVDVASVEANFRVVKSGAPLQQHYQYMTTAFDGYTREAYHLFMDQKQMYQQNEKGPISQHRNFSMHAA